MAGISHFIEPKNGHNSIDDLVYEKVPGILPIWLKGFEHSVQIEIL